MWKKWFFCDSVPRRCRYSLDERSNSNNKNFTRSQMFYTSRKFDLLLLCCYYFFLTIFRWTLLWCWWWLQKSLYSHIYIWDWWWNDVIFKDLRMFIHFRLLIIFFKFILVYKIIEILSIYFYRLLLISKISITFSQPPCNERKQINTFWRFFPLFRNDYCHVIVFPCDVREAMKKCRRLENVFLEYFWLLIFSFFRFRNFLFQWVNQ